MIHVVSTWLLVAAFFGAGAFNAIATAANQASFVRWGYPAWWSRVTGALEILVAGLIALPVSRLAGLGIGAAIILAAAITVLRHRDFTHLAPLGLFAALLALAVAPI